MTQFGLIKGGKEEGGKGLGGQEQKNQQQKQREQELMGLKKNMSKITRRSRSREGKE